MFSWNGALLCLGGFGYQFRIKLFNIFNDVPYFQFLGSYWFGRNIRSPDRRPDEQVVRKVARPCR